MLYRNELLQLAFICETKAHQVLDSIEDILAFMDACEFGSVLCQGVRHKCTV
jgi:hypothetical protein